MNPEDLVGYVAPIVDINAVKSHFDEMADGELVYLFYNDTYCRIQRIDWARGVLRFALCSNAEIVGLDNEVIGNNVRITSVHCNPITQEDFESLRDDLENVLEIDLVLESNKTTLISSDIFGYLEL